MTLEECMEGYKILKSAFSTVYQLEDVERNYRYYLKDLDCERFIQACINAGSQATTKYQTRLPTVEDLLGEYKLLEPKKEREIGVDKKPMSPEMKELLKKWEKERKFKL